MKHMPSPKSLFELSSHPVFFIDSNADLLPHLEVLPALYGFDTEFVSGKRYVTSLGLVQIALESTILLIDPTKVDLTLLRPLLDSPAICIAHSPEADLTLIEEAAGTRPAHLFDTQIAARFLGHSTPSLASLLDEYLNIQLDKSERMTNWLARPLPDKALTYAALDVAHLASLYESLVESLTTLNRLDFAKEESERIRLHSPAPRVDNLVWHRMKNVRRLPLPVKRRIASLAAMRESIARHRNRLVNHVLTDDAIIALALADPKNAEAVRACLSSRRVKPDLAQAIIKAVATASAPDFELIPPPPEPSDRGIEDALALATASIIALSEELSIDRTLLATRADLINFISNQPSRIGQGWRATLVAPHLKKQASQPSLFS